MNIQFDNAWILYFLWVIPLIAFWWIGIYKRKKKALNKFVEPQLQKKLFPQQNFNRPIWQIGLVSGALLLLLIAVAGPKWGEREETVYQQARDLVIAVDVSRSMLANDVHPSRLGRAKIDLIDLIKELKGDRAALIAFRAKASLICPLTTDYAFLRQALDGLSPNSAPRGETNIGSAIKKALESFDEGDASHKAIVLISDGEDLTGKALDLAKEAGKKHIPIFTVGIGSIKGSRIPDQDNQARYLRHDNKDVITKLNNDTLYKIAKASGGTYIPIETASMTKTTLGTIYNDHLRRITARELAETHKTRAIERYQWFLFFAIILLLSAALLSRGRIGTKTSNPVTSRSKLAKARVASISALLLFSAINLRAQTNTITTSQTNTPPEAVSNTSTNAISKTIPPGRKGARYAQKLFKKGEYAEAAEAYLQSTEGVSRDAALDFKHNAAIALLEDGQYDKAADILRSVTMQSRPDDRDENGLLGTAIFHTAETMITTNSDQLAERANLLHESAEAFKEAWRTNPTDDNSRDNIAVLIPKITKTEEQAKIMRLTKQYEKTPAPQLANQMLKQQRRITKELPSAITNQTPDRIHLLEGLADRQEQIADLWIPLTGKMQQAMQKQGSASNAQHFAALNQLMTQAQEEMRDGAAKLRDLDPEGFRSAKISEHETYQLWKTVAPYDMLLGEDILQQTNAISLTNGSQKPDQYTDPIAIQKETALLTELFKNRFEKAVPKNGTQKGGAPTQPSPAHTLQPQPGGPTVASLNRQLGTTNQLAGVQGGISATNRAKIVELATQTIALQKDAAQLLEKKQKQDALTKQKISHKNLLEIQKLLPKKNNQNQKKNQKQQKQQQKNKNQKQQQKKQQKNQQKQQQQQKKQQQQKQKSEKQKKQEQKRQEVKKMLKKALEREKEHKEEKAKRINNIPLPPFEKDW